MREPVQNTWFSVNPDDILVTQDNYNVFQTKLRLSRDREVNTRSIYTVLDWLGDVGGLVDALQYIGKFVMFLYFKLVSEDPITHFLVTSLFKK